MFERSSILPLDQRKQRILKLIVHDYVQTAEPVASEFLVSRHRLEVRSATVRNEMAEMSEMGYLRQPHTSAGRVPSDLGYRFYVDRLMEPGTLRGDQRDAARSAYGDLESDIEHILLETCRVLAYLTRYASVATQTSGNEVEIRHVSLSALQKDKLLLIIAFSDGRVEHRILRGEALAKRELAQVSAALEDCLSDRTVGEVWSGAAVETPPQIARYADLFQLAAGLVRQAAKNVLEGGVFVDGTGYILRQPEFQDVHRAEALLEALEQRRSLFNMLSTALLGPETFVVIGSENPCAEMRECSFVASRYQIAGRSGGAIGVVGPTRMDYRRAVAAVRFMANSLTDLLTSLSIG